MYCIVIYTSLAPVGVPLNVRSTSTARSISVSWDEIDCIERNGMITGYLVRFQQADAATVTNETRVILGTTFSTSELHFLTNYIFQVAGMTSVGTGPFTNPITIHTNEDGKKFIRMKAQIDYSCPQFLAWCLTSHLDFNIPH